MGTDNKDQRFGRIDPIFRNEQKKMLSWLLFHGCRRDDAEDVFQDCWLKLLRSSAPLPPDDLGLLRFLWVCLMNAYWSYLRALGKKTEPLDDTIPVPEVPASQVEAVMLSEAIACCQEKVEPKAWDSFALRMSGLKWDEVLVILEVSSSTAQTYCARTKAQFEACLTQTGWKL